MTASPEEISPPPALIAYSVPGAMAATGLPRTTIFQLIQRGQIETRKIGRRRLILADSLRRYIETA